MKQLQFRLSYLLDSCINQEQTNQFAYGFQSTLSHFEEIELIVSIVFQLSEKAQVWAEHDIVTFANFKDLLLF
jgi:hypothetical protein